jgi:predicted nucleotidyltransferase component of viral defense system
VTATHPKVVLLRRRARDENRPVAEILQYYAMERFLFRLGVSPHADAFVLKGAMMLRVWDAPTARPTRDIDFLAFGPNDLSHVVSRLREICDISVPDDGLRFDVDSFRAERIKEGDDYHGARVRFVGELGKTRIQMQIDLGFGDVVHPEITWADFPTLLDDPAPRIRLYSRETVIAEKLHAMVKLASLNSRMKDFHDILHLSHQGSFALENLAQAIAKTFQARGTPVPTDIVSWKAEYVESHAAMWRSYLSKVGEPDGPALSEVANELQIFLAPALAAAQEHQSDKSG